MIAFNHVVPVLNLSVFNVRRAPAFAFEQSKRATIGGRFIRVDESWDLPLLHVVEDFTQKPVCSFAVTTGGEIKIDSAAPAVDGPVQIRPAAIDLHVGFIHVPRAKIGRVTPVPAQPFFHFRRITLNPAVNRGVIDIHSAFSQHLLQLTVTDAVFAVPAYGPQNDVTLKMPAFEWVHVQLHQQKGMISLSPPTICNSASNNIKNKKKNYREVEELLAFHYQEIEGEEFYKYIFPNNQDEGEMSGDYSKPNAIYLYKDPKDEGTERKLRRRIMLNDTWEEDYRDFVEDNPMTLCSGLAYRGRINRLEYSQQMNALVFDLDAVGKNELINFFSRIGKKPGLRTLPQPTFIVMSGTGLHIYYVFKEPIALYPNIKLQMKQLKYDLTFKMWEYKATSQEKQIQYQSINQGFRMVGSRNDKYDLPVKAFKTGERVTLDYINSYADEEKNRVDINKRFRPTQYSLEEAEEKFPEWYERVIVQGDKRAKRWDIKRDLYDWWLRQSYKVKGGHRYFYLMCMAIYAVKCNIPKNEVREDMYKIFDELKEIEHSNPLEEDDIKSALETYDRQYYNFTIDDIVKLTDIPIEKNKRNYRKQDQHLKLARGQLELLKEMGEVEVGRPSKESLVREYLEDNPEHSPTEIARNLGISRTTVYKYLN